MTEIALLDFDGSIVNSLPLWSENCKTVARDQFGVCLPDEVVTHRIFHDLALIAEFGVPIAPYVDAVIQAMERDKRLVTLHYGMDQTLRELKAMGTKLAIITSSKDSWALPILQSTVPDISFEMILTRDENMRKGLRTKPAPDGLLYVLQALHIQPQQALMVGDSNADVLAGRSAGVATCVFYPDENKPFYTESTIANFQSTYVIHSAHELLDLVKL